LKRFLGGAFQSAEEAGTTAQLLTDFGFFFFRGRSDNSADFDQ
jgi:hypothetical protein